MMEKNICDMYLEDEGFKQDRDNRYRWEKILEYADGKEVVEVVYLMGDNEALHREITYEYLDDGLSINNPEAEGFKQDRSDSDLWTKTIEDIDGKKVVEEVYFLGDQVFHSKKTYENMPIDENLKIVAQNTWEREYVSDYDSFDEWC